MPVTDSRARLWRAMFDLNARLTALLFDNAQLHASSPLGWVLRVLRYPYALIRDLVRGELNMRAMSLVYTTLLSVVPLVAFSFSLIKGLGMSATLEPVIHEFLRPMGEDAGQLTTRVLEFADNIRGTVVGSVGLAVLVFTVLSTIQKVEESLNFVWRVERPRSFARRVMEYLSMMVIGPIVLVTAFGLVATTGNSGWARSLMQWPLIAPLATGIGKLVPYVIITGIFTFLFGFIPNARVRFLPALIGGATAGFLWAASGAGFSAFVHYSTQLVAVYTGFAVVITAIIWVYLSWLILMIGAQLSFYVQNPHYLRRGHEQIRLAGSVAERVAFNVMYLVGRAYQKGERIWTTNLLAQRFDMPSITLAGVVHALEHEGLLVATEDECLIPGRDMHEIRLTEILDAVRRRSGSGPHATAHTDPAVDQLAQGIEKTMNECIANRSLADLAKEG
ncbi:MAG TPA: YihY/virulence factor BrkB family protein [Steroidobacteraceae bacterium]|nr:YihY/virulence factor BrkB family protein [Steroidobacteraceae bacterium]